MASRSGAEANDEDEEVLCRICRCEATSEDRLLYPCACRGSIKFVHQDCLFGWIMHSNSLHCEVCNHRYSFALVYAEKPPAKLSGLQFLTRVAIVLFVWLVMVPLVSAQILDLVFTRSFSQLGGFHFHWLHNYKTILQKIKCGQVVFLFYIFVIAVKFICKEVFSEKKTGVVDGGRKKSFGEIIGMRGSAVNLMKLAFKVQLWISLLLVLGVFVPFSWGRIEINRRGYKNHGDWTTLASGYLSMLQRYNYVGSMYNALMLVLVMLEMIGINCMINFRRMLDDSF